MCIFDCLISSILSFSHLFKYLLTDISLSDLDSFVLDIYIY